MVGRSGMAGALLAVTVVAGAAPTAMQMALDQRAVSEALAIGQSRIESERARFHMLYRIAVAKAPIDLLHVVTPFRRLVIAAEERARLGGSGLTQREALDLLANVQDRLDLYLELSFHPLNTYLGVPSYEVRLAEAGQATVIEPRLLERYPRYGPRVEGAPLPSPGTGNLLLPRGSQPLLGATVLAGFDLERLEANGSYDVVTSEGGKELARVRITLAPLR